MARPRKKVDVETLKKLAAIHCTTEEMASVLGVSKDTLERRFAATIKEGRAHGRMSLKRKQYEMAVGGNTTMLIWLGKQYLEQRDKASHELSGPDGKPIEHRDLSKMSDEELKEQADSLALKLGYKPKEEG